MSNNRPGWLLVTGIIFTLILMSGQLQAHQKKEAVTRVIFNQRTENIEIIHRFLIHDAEHAAKKLFGNTADLIENKTSQQQFSEYVVENFSIKNLSNQPLPLSTVGFEIDGRYIWIYQETPLQSEIKGMTITNNALRELWSAQTNLLNIERNKKVRSLIFKGPLAEQTITF